MTRPNQATRVLALMGLGVSFSFFDGPHIVNYDFRAVAVCVAQLFMLFGLAAMVHFLLLFPSRRPLLQRSWGKKLVYIPVLIIWMLIAWRVLFTPSSGSLAAFVSQFFSGIGTTVYLLLGLFLLLRGYSRTDRDERKRLALNRMLWATIAAIIPTVVAQLASIVSPDTPLPGQDYYFVLLALIPMTWSLSAARA
jgi:Na+/melibiose symporter-like transporter